MEQDNLLKNENEKILVIGIGNPLLSDDTVGLHVIDRAKLTLKNSVCDITFKKAYNLSFDLFYDLVGFKKAILIDCIEDTSEKTGSVLEYIISNQIDSSIIRPNLAESHGNQLFTILALGRKYGYVMPELIIIYGIVGQDLFTFSEQPTAEVYNSIEYVVEKIGDKII